MEKIRDAVEATVAAGTAHYEILLEAEPVTRSRSRGVCDFLRQREAGNTTTEIPEGVPEVFQICDGGVVYTQDGTPEASGDRWHVMDMGGRAGSVLLQLGWLYGVVDARAGDEGEHIVTMNTRRAVEDCPEPLRDDLRTSFAQSGHLDAVATGRVRTDEANRVTELHIDTPPPGADGLFPAADIRARITLTLSDFGSPASIQPPDAGPAVAVEDMIEKLCPRTDDER